MWILVMKMQRTGWILEIIHGVESDGTPGQSVLHEDMIWRIVAQRFLIWERKQLFARKEDQVWGKVYEFSCGHIFEISMWRYSGRSWGEMFWLSEKRPELELWQIHRLHVRRPIRLRNNRTPRNERWAKETAARKGWQRIVRIRKAFEERCGWLAV